MKRYLFGMIMAVALIASAPQKSEAYTTGSTGAYYTSVANYYANPTYDNYVSVSMSYLRASNDPTSLGFSSSNVNIRLDMLSKFFTIAYINNIILPANNNYNIGYAPVSPT